jgi:rhodanese-related sulfurtransferase
MEFWLIQRGSFNNLQETHTGLTGREGLVYLDYMGSSEFEWGAIPKAYRRIMGQFDDYAHNVISDIKNYKGESLIVFCHKNKVDVIVNELKKFVNKPYRLKEHCGLESHITGEGFWAKCDLKKDFFWSIDGKEIGDWMAFFGDDKLKPFNAAIKKDYNDWWMAKSKETREKEYKESLNTF